MAVNAKSTATPKFLSSEAIQHRKENLRQLIANSQKVRAEVHRTRVTAKRLRLDCAKANLELAEHLAVFTNPQEYGEKTATAFRNGILNTFMRVQQTISRPGWTALDRRALQSRLDRLGILLTDLGIAVEGIPAVPDLLPAEGSRVSQSARCPDELTKRETEVLRCIAEGRSTKEVADVLGISFKTAACHRYRIMNKLDIHDTVHLVRYAIRQGLVQV